MVASMLLRASRVATRAACSAVSAASRRAAGAGSAGAAVPDLLLPRSTPVASPLFGRYRASRRTAVACLGGAGAQDLLLRRSTPVASPPFGRCLSSLMARSDQGTLEPLTRPAFEVDDKDLESDEALWAFYERWCKFWGQERSREEMQRRFDLFKDTVLFVHRCNKNGDQLEVGMFADGKLAEQKVCMCKEVFDSLPYSKSLILGRAGPMLFNNK
ncbi:hypothetical protein SEVIR_5G151600v4 [Setaria viridis]|uniref:Cathepsin propeptide inhibitor domain-containing protein n=1 Tax=Setaria viridis TaxID=4556 RepID=A0A4U6UDW5_SETVI|nr:uncharacterized protein LOC117854587 [Setaria viridis]TKW14190.1 hypothetical protein SEVIR_5G151600v2 [Setaria viridis]